MEFLTHNNMGKGLDNSLTAKESGVTWIDSTITGMGRGAGNTQTECLLAVLAESETSYSPEPVYELVVRYFEEMQKKYGCGVVVFYIFLEHKMTSTQLIFKIFYRIHIMEPMK